MAAAEDFDYLDELPPRLGVHPDALRWYGMFRHRGPADRRYLIAKLREVLSASGGFDEDSTAERCRVEYLRFVRETGATSHDGYIEWWERQDDDSLPTAGQIRHHLGGGRWANVTNKYGAEALADTSAAQLRALGPFFVEREILDPLAVYASETEGYLTVTGFLDFCRAELEKADPRWVRLPLSYQPIQRLFPKGRLHEALTKIGLAHRHISRRSGRIRRERHSWTQEEARPFVKPAFDDLGSGVNEHSYDRWAKAQRAKMKAAGLRDPRVPSSRTLAGLFGSFVLALLDCGLIDEVEALKRSNRGGPKLPDDLLRAALADAMWEEGDDIAAHAYMDVRLRWFVQAARRGDAIRVPSSASIAIRIGGGSWTAARRAVQRWTAETGYQPKIRTDA